MTKRLEISRDVAAPPDQVYVAISDVTRMGEWSEECHACDWHEGYDGPVVGATFVLVHTTQDKPDHGKETLKFFDWAFKNGSQAADALDYISLPDAVVTEIRSQWQTKVKDASGKPVAN